MNTTEIKTAPPEPSPMQALPKSDAWYKTALIYEVHVRAFYDSDGDGTGDFRGLTMKLDYLHNLGITAIWLLPFYPSPLKDDGYDISDYYDVHPRYGTLADFKVFLREAHKRGIRVITELVMNHTSDQHPWFQRSRRAKPGSHWRDFYVWSDTPDKYKGTRVIFKDTEISNWTLDPLAKSYYWHRFYSHQPDLNFEHPPVREEMFRLLDFWLDMGVDGVRLDAVPYLFERDGTSCENLPETHEFLKTLRKHVDDNYKDRMLLAEANQWPDDAVAYFGQGAGDECHMAFHFPLMPRLFMALRMEDRIPIVDILQQTPPIPDTAQWALFLRNHDELTLEMVTDEERDYMYRMYAQIHQARLNLGIRRRLAPLVGNDRKRIELLTALLFSLPGTPVIYYGDEIGMGENIYLGDRNGVRTPMQWSSDKNAGFSHANPQSLFLPVNVDPENHYQAINVETQEQNRHSLLWWMRQLTALRQRWKGFGLGTLEFLQPENRKILAYLRRHEGSTVLVVANLSRMFQPVELDLSAFQGYVPVELFGRNELPPIADKPYFMTLGPHSFCWFMLKSKVTPQAESSDSTPVGAQARALLTGSSDWSEVLEFGTRVRLEAALQSWLPSRRWFAGKARTVKNVTITESICVPIENEKAYLNFVQVDYLQTESELYVVPLACAFGEKCDQVCRDWPSLVLARVNLTDTNQDGVIYDAIGDKGFCRAMLDLISTRRGLQGNKGKLTAMHTAMLRKLRREKGLALEPSVSKAEQSNSSIIYGDRLFLKFFRRLDAGINPELEIGKYLSDQKFSGTSPLDGALEYVTGRQEPVTVAVLNTFVPGCTTAWDYTLDALGRFYERVQTFAAPKNVPPSVPNLPLVKLAAMELPDEAKDAIGSYTEDVRLLAKRTAELHRVLAADSEQESFHPEPWTSNAQRGLFQSMRNLTRQNFQLLNQRLKLLPPDVQPLAQQVLAAEPALVQRLRRIYAVTLDSVRTRYHGDYHLGQILHTGKDFLIIDFEGEPEVALSERRLKRSPLRDVAGLISSFHYAAYAALLKQTEHGAQQASQMEAAVAWSRYWSTWVGAIYLKMYLSHSRGAPYLPSNEEGLSVLIECELVRNVVYELGYELNNRPDWVRLPLQAILDLVNQGGK